MLSYEPMKDRNSTMKTTIYEPEPIEAEIFLYSKDLSDVNNPWEIASVEKIAGKYGESNVLVCVWLKT